MAGKTPARYRVASVSHLIRTIFAMIVLAGAGGVASLWGAMASRAEPPRMTFVIEVGAGGFNPAMCKISRGDLVFFKNVDSQPHRVIWADPNGGAPLFDSGAIAPGVTTTSASADFNFPSRWVFQDADNVAHKVVVVTPTLSNSWTPDCSPAPTAPPPAQPCGGAVGCIRAPQLAADR
jgi:plastocyanin